MPLTALPNPVDHARILVPPPVYYIAGLAGGWLAQLAAPLPYLPRQAAAPGVLLVGAGVLFALWGVFTLRKRRTTILPHRPVSRFVIAGPYRLTRNPMYVGLLIAYAGASLLLRLWWPLMLAPLLVLLLTLLVIRREEAYLERTFGQPYRRYRATVRRWV